MFSIQCFIFLILKLFKTSGTKLIKNEEVEPVMYLEIFWEDQFQQRVWGGGCTSLTLEDHAYLQITYHYVYYLKYSY